MEQSLLEYSAGRPRRGYYSAPISIKVMPFLTQEVYQQENVGKLVAEIVARHLRRIKELSILADPTDSGQGPGSTQLVVSGEVSRRDGTYDITFRIDNPEHDRMAATRELSIPVGAFHNVLDRHLRWKRRRWLIQPYLQALYTERYLGDGYPPRVVSSSENGVAVSTLVSPERLVVDETAEFALGLRLNYRRRFMLDMAYTAHGHSSTSSQQIASMTNLLDSIHITHLAMYVSTTAVAASLNLTGPLSGDLNGYAGAGWERTTAVQTVSSMARLWSSGIGGKTEVRGYFVDSSSPLPEGGDIVKRASVPFVRAGIEWRPRRFGFNFLFTYRLGTGDFSPLTMAVEEIHTSASDSTVSSISYNTVELTKYRLPRLSLGAAFSFSL